MHEIRQTTIDLDTWRLRTRHLEIPEEGSDLALDNSKFTHHAISEFIRSSLISAGEHLRLAAIAIHQGILFPTSHFTVLRGALVSSAQACWLLAPDESTERQRRGLSALDAMYGEMIKYANAVSAMSDDTADRNALETKLPYLHDCRAELTAVRKGDKLALNQTMFISAALTETLPDRPELIEHGNALWREMSSDAHALGWSLLQRAVFAPGGDSGPTEATVVPNLVEIQAPYMISFLLLERGWSMFDARSKAK